VKSEKGVFMEVLEGMMRENGIHLHMLGLKEALQKIIRID